MSLDPLLSMPDTLQAGLTWSVRFSVSDFPASDGWALTVYFSSSAGNFSKLCTADGDDHIMTIPAADTEDYVAGDYAWTARATLAADAYEAVKGTVEVLADLGAEQSVDRRSHNVKVLEALQAAIEGRASSVMNEYTVSTGTGTRTLRYMTTEEIMKALGIYEARVRAEKMQERIDNGLPASSNRRPRFHE